MFNSGNDKALGRCRPETQNKILRRHKPSPLLGPGIRREARGPRSPAQDSSHSLLRLPCSPLQDPLRDRAQKGARAGFNAHHPETQSTPEPRRPAEQAAPCPGARKREFSSPTLEGAVPTPNGRGFSGFVLAHPGSARTYCNIRVIFSIRCSSFRRCMTCASNITSIGTSQFILGSGNDLSPSWRNPSSKAKRTSSSAGHFWS